MNFTTRIPKDVLPIFNRDSPAFRIMCPDAEAPLGGADEVGVPVGDPEIVDAVVVELSVPVAVLVNAPVSKFPVLLVVNAPETFRPLDPLLLPLPMWVPSPIAVWLDESEELTLSVAVALEDDDWV